MALGQCNPQSKLLWHFSRVVEWEKTGDTSPILFEIDPSNKCNHDCPWCSFSKLRSENKDMLCWDVLKSMLDSMKAMGVKAINWTGGGEPLLNPETIKAIQYAKEIGLDQGIFTNGQLMTQEKADIMAKCMTWVRVSLDGYNSESYAWSHGTSSVAFYKVLANLKYFASIQDRCTLGIGFILHEKNYEGITEIAHTAKDLGVDYIQFKPEIRRPGIPQVDPTFFKEKIFPLLETAEKLSTNKFNVMITTYRFNDVLSPETNYGRNYKKCLSHFFQGAIGADSKVYLCDHHKGEKEYEFGNLKENTLQEVWDSSRRKEVIKFLDSTDLSQCQACCRNHETNKFLWNIKNVRTEMHPNHI